jgi:hypothetical protein
MAPKVHVDIELDRDLHASLSVFANGIGLALEDVIEAAVKYAVRSRYPDNSLPGDQPGIDNELPGDQPEIDNSLPRPPFDPEVEIDNELPEGEIPPEIDNSLPEYQPRPSHPIAGGDFNPNPNPDVDVDKDAPRPDQELPDTPQPKK